MVDFETLLPPIPSPFKRGKKAQKTNKWENEYQDCLNYIDSYWDRVTHRPKREVIDHYVITIPKPFISPNHHTPDSPWKFQYIFYWDTFFMFRGLIRTKREWLLKSMVENFIFIFEKYGIMPNFNAPASMGRSQPPFFTSMILDTYNGYYFASVGENKFLKLLTNRLTPHKLWLKKAAEVAKREYRQVWLDPDGNYNHSVKGFSLARYGDRDVGYAHSSELESGWDFTSRFYNRCDDFLPIDLNVLLFKYERDFAKIASILGDREEELYWRDRANKRKQEVNRLMWDDKAGFFFDYGYRFERISNFYSLAGFTPLWAGLASREQAAKMVKQLKRFETDHALTITDKESLARPIDLSSIQKRYHPAILDIIKPKQWDYPNSWPPLEYLTTIGLLKYGYVDEAKRLMQKYVKTHAAIFRKFGSFTEKINGVTGEKADSFHYVHQEGFGWTNAAFYRYIQILDSLENGEEIYRQPKAEDPPYKLAIPH
jgi:alpha,alpha-trehalase